jgi:methionyl aminopeptidase
MITIKSDSEIRLMAEAGKITATALDAVRKAVRPGVTTLELDEIAKDVIRSFNAVPTFYNYNGFPGNICASINDEIVHGIPCAGRALKAGDIVSIDIGATYDGFVGDMADTYPVGEVSKESAALIETTRASFYAGLEYCTEGMRLYDVSHAIQQKAESKGYGVVRVYVGHGIGRHMHEDPSVPNYGTPGRGIRLQNGMTLAIEPMVNIGTYETTLCDDDWTVKTADGSLSAHYEHTVALTKSGPVLLTVM